jgi:hypothetical protein
LATRRTSLKKSLRAIERAFSDIESALKHLGRRVRKAERAASRNGRVAGTRRPVTLTAKRRAQLKLQGAYMGYMRQLKPAQKARVKAVKEKRGFRGAIAVARKLAANK